MKKTAFIAVVVLGSLSANAYAGGGCQYGHAPKVAVADDVLENDVSEVTDPRFIALLKKQEAEKAEVLESIITYN